MNRKFIFLAIASSFAIIAIFAVMRGVERSAASEQCAIDSLYALPREEQERCVQEAGGKASFMATVEARQIATAEARPAVTVPTRPRPIRTPTSVGFTPAFAERIEPVPNEGQDFRGTQSVWLVGAIQNTEGMHFPFLIYTAEVRCRIGTIVETEASDAPFTGVPINEYWDCPSNNGILTITDVTSPTGIISFENEQGQKGTFNIATTEWTFEGEAWIAPIQETPQSEMPPSYP